MDLETEGIFDICYQEYEDELRGIALMHTGIRVDAGAYREARKQAAKRLVFNVLEKFRR
jgi:hypothetical protein